MNKNIQCLMLFIVVISCNQCAAFKILFLLPYNGTSHHIYYTPIIEELAKRNHQVTVVNYLPLRNTTNIRQISLQDKTSVKNRRVIMKQYYQNLPNYLSDIFILTENVHAQKEMATINCEKIFSNSEVLKLIEYEEKFDVFVLEQFYSDCGLAWANKLNVPIIGMSAHILLPWTYPRLGAPNNPAYVPSRIGKNGLWARMKAIFLNIYSVIYFRNKIQKTDHSIASRVIPNTPDLEDIAKNVSLVMVNQYFPLTGSRIYAPNVVEIGGMHIKSQGLDDEKLLQFIESAEHGVVYISFGSVACGLPEHKIEAILKVISKSEQKFIWKADTVVNTTLPENLIIRHWIPQVDVLCHPNVKAFVTHAGMLSSAEAMHCGVPVVSVPIFGDQFANAQSTKENGLGVIVDFVDLKESTLENALEEVLQERYQSRAKYLSSMWRDRPVSPLDTAVYWIEFVARYRGAPSLRPPTVNLPLYQYLMLDVWLILGSVITLVTYINFKILMSCINSYRKKCVKKVH